MRTWPRPASPLLARARAAAAHPVQRREIRGETGAPTEARAGSEDQGSRSCCYRRESTDPAKREVGAAGAALPDGRLLVLAGQGHIADIWTQGTSRSTCWSSCTPGAAPVHCLVRPLVTGWVAKSEIWVGAFTISSVWLARNDRCGSQCCIKPSTAQMGATRSANKIAGSQPTSRTDRRPAAEDHQPRAHGGAFAAGLPSIRKPVGLRTVDRQAER